MLFKSLYMQPASQSANTEQPQNQIELKQKLAIDEAIISSVGDGLIITDKESKILLMNPAAAQMLRQNPKEVIGRDLIDIVPAADLKSNIIPREKPPLLSVISSR